MTAAEIEAAHRAAERRNRTVQRLTAFAVALPTGLAIGAFVSKLLRRPPAARSPGGRRVQR